MFNPDSAIARLAAKARTKPKDGIKPERPAPLQKKTPSEKTNKLSRRPFN